MAMKKDAFYHGTRADYQVGDSIFPAALSDTDAPENTVKFLFLTRNPDEAIWDAELAEGDTPPRVYIVEPTGEVAEGADPAMQGHPTMSLHTSAPLRIQGEVTEWRLYHGTKADLNIGDLISAGYNSNFGSQPRKANHVYMSRTLDASIWGAELAVGEGKGRIYIVEPTGPIEDDPNLTDSKFRGNPSKSFRSRMPLRVIGEILEWRGHPEAIVQKMKKGVKKLSDQGIEPEDD